MNARFPTHGAAKPGGRTARRLQLWLAAAIACCALTCEKTAAPDVTPPEVAILSPADRSVVADTVTVRVAASDDHRVRSVTFLVDGTTVAERHEPPWEIPWMTGSLPDSSYHTLRAAAVDDAGNASLSTEARVCVRHNDPPTIRILWPPEDYWIDLDEPLLPWRCAAHDPNEGLLDEDHICWYLDGALIEQKGKAIEAPELSCGAHTIRAQASDSWDRSTAALRSIQAFRYPDGTDPSAALEVFLCAVRARNADVATACLAEEFRFFRPGRTSGATDWGSATEAQALRALLGDTRLEILTVEGRMGPVETFVWQGKELAKIELRDLTLRGVLCCQEPDEEDTHPADRDAETVWRVATSAARIYLTPGSSSDEALTWSLLAWWDLHGATWCGRAGPSWTDLKQTALADRLCD